MVNTVNSSLLPSDPDGSPNPPHNLKDKSTGGKGDGRKACGEKIFLTDYHGYVKHSNHILTKEVTLSYETAKWAGKVPDKEK